MSREEPLFFRNHNSDRLFGILHHASGYELNCPRALVCCYPLFEERLWSHHILTRFARFASERGYDVFRFDYFGDGESAGLFEEASISSRLSDIGSATEFLKTHRNTERVYLVGLRIGGTLSILFDQKEESVSGRIAWAPVFNLKKYLYALLRLNLTTQMVMNKTDHTNRESMVQTIEAGGTVNVEGYEIANPLWSESCAIDVKSAMKTMRKPGLIVDIASNHPMIQSDPENPFDLEFIREREFWQKQERVFPACKELFSRTISWIDRIDETFHNEIALKRG